jgi:hypothetical protein
VEEEAVAVAFRRHTLTSNDANCFRETNAVDEKTAICAVRAASTLVAAEVRLPGELPGH